MAEISESNIRKIMGRVWEIDPAAIPLGVGFNDIIQWDSLGHVNLLIALEKEYNIAIDYEMLTKLVSISAIIQFLKDNVHVG